MAPSLTPHSQPAWRQVQSTTSLIRLQTGHFALACWESTITPWSNRGGSSGWGGHRRPFRGGTFDQRPAIRMCIMGLAVEKALQVDGMASAKVLRWESAWCVHEQL